MKKRKEILLAILLVSGLVGLAWWGQKNSPTINPRKPSVSEWLRPSLSPSAEAVAINSRGRVVGESGSGTAVLFTGHEKYEPLNLRGFDPVSTHDISDKGVVAGSLEEDDRRWVCLINHSTVFALKWADTEGSRSPSISPDGNYVSCMVSKAGVWKPVLVELAWEKGHPKIVRTQYLKTTGFDSAHTQDVNNQGVVVGQLLRDEGSFSRAVAWRPDGSVNLLSCPEGTVRSSAAFVNRNNQVAGKIDGRACRWEGTGVSYLPLPDDVLTAYIAGMDDRGYILGTGVLRRELGEYREPERDYLDEIVLVWPTNAEKAVYTANELIPEYGPLEMDSDGREELDFRQAIAMSPDGRVLARSMWGASTTLSAFVVESPQDR